MLARADRTSKHLWLLAFPILSVLSVKLDYHIGYVLIAGIAFAVGLVAFNKLSEKLYPWLLFSIGLSLIWQTTLFSSYLVGTDIHMEYYFEQLTEATGHWNSTIPFSFNSATGVTVVIPFLCRWLHLDAIIVFKAFIPLLLAGVPVILYYIFRKQFGAIQGFLASVFFIMVPIFALEIPCLIRQEIAELFLALCLLLVVIRFNRLGKWQIPLIILLGALVAINHYSMWVILMLFLVVTLLVSVVLKFWKVEQAISIKGLALSVVLIGISGLIFYQATSSGVVLGKLVQLVPQQMVLNREGMLKPLINIIVPPNTSMIEQAPSVPTEQPYEPLMKAAIGLDFPNSSDLGKVFRIIQYITQVLIVIGSGYCLYLFIRKRNRLNAQYIGMLSAGAFILILCVFVPTFSWAMNASRLYHAALLGLAPMFVVGGLLVCRTPRILFLAVLLPYFAFTSGVVFELTKTSSIEAVNMPYNTALTNHRLDLTGSLTHDDEVVRDWAYENELEPVYGDLHAADFLYERYGTDGAYSSKKIDAFPDDAYIFLRSRNNDSNTLVKWMGVGMRYFEPYGIEDFGDRDILYQCGSAMILGPRRDV